MLRHLRVDCRNGDVASLIAALDSDEEIRHLPVRAVAARHLGHLRAAEAVPTLLRLLDDPNDIVRRAAATALGRIGDPRATPSLLKSLDDPVVRHNAIASLGEIGDVSAIPRLVEIGENGGWLERPPALYALFLMPDEHAQSTARRLLARQSFSSRRAIRSAARKFEKRRGRRYRHRLPVQF